MVTDDGLTTFHFCVICPTAQQVYLLGPFNHWSTTATPMVRTEESVWQLSIRLGEEQQPQGEHPFSYFVIDRGWMTGRAPFGNTYMLPGSWATVLREPACN
jgi:1,4-alpha-glucan branching enzyme